MSATIVLPSANSTGPVGFGVVTFPIGGSGAMLVIGGVNGSNGADGADVPGIIGTSDSGSDSTGDGVVTSNEEEEPTLLLRAVGLGEI